MIVTKNIKVKICYKNLKHYKSKGYNVKNGDEIIVPVEDLTPQSNKKILVKCDVCGKEKEIKYQTYMFNVNNGGYYACSSKCAWDKNRKTNLERYGTEVPMSNEEIKNKSKKTVLEKYGVDNISKSQHFKDKYKEIMLDKYGVINGFQSEEIKEKIKETNIEKYGSVHHFKNEKYKEKYLYGENNNAYIDGRSYEEDDWVNNKGKAFKKEFFSQNERVCICCGLEKRKMQIHHLESRNIRPDLIFDKNNLVIICENCHKDFHKKYGYGNNTKEQFEKYLKEINK